MNTKKRTGMVILKSLLNSEGLSTSYQKIEFRKEPFDFNQKMFTLKEESFLKHSGIKQQIGSITEYSEIRIFGTLLGIITIPFKNNTESSETWMQVIVEVIKKRMLLSPYRLYVPQWILITKDVSIWSPHYREERHTNIYYIDPEQQKMIRELIELK